MTLIAAVALFIACDTKTVSDPQEEVKLTHYQKLQNKFDNELGQIPEFKNITLSRQGPTSESYVIYIPQNYIKHVSSANNIAFFDQETGFSIVVSDIYEIDSVIQLKWLENIGQIISDTYQVPLNKVDWQKENGPFEEVFSYANLDSPPVHVWAIKNFKKTLMIQVSKSSELSENDIKLARFVINNIVLENIQD